MAPMGNCLNTGGGSRTHISRRQAGPPVHEPGQLRYAGLPQKTAQALRSTTLNYSCVVSGLASVTALWGFLALPL